MKRDTTREDLLRLLETLLEKLPACDPELKRAVDDAAKVADRDNARFELDQACRQFLEDDRT